MKPLRLRMPAHVRAETPVLLVFAVVIVSAAWLFFEIVEDLVIKDPFSGPDRWTYLTLQGFRSPTLDQWMVGVTELGDTLVVVAVSLCACLWLVKKRAWRALTFGILAVGCGSAINTAIKLAMHRARPSDLHYHGASLFSFPSGHSTTNAALYGAVIILAGRGLPWRGRLALGTGLVLFVGAIAMSRLYLGAHWLSDVGGGLTFASAWLALLGMVYMWHHAEDIDALAFLVVVTGALLLFGGINIALHHTSDMQVYAAPAARVPSP